MLIPRTCVAFPGNEGFKLLISRPWEWEPGLAYPGGPNGSPGPREWRGKESGGRLGRWRKAPKAKKCKEPPGAGKGRKQLLPEHLQRDHRLADTLILAL